MYPVVSLKGLFVAAGLIAAVAAAPEAQAEDGTGVRWGGIYIGGALGGARLSSDFRTQPSQVLQGSFDAHNYGLADTGFAGGVLAGYNWSLNSSLVLGVEADWTWSRLGDSATGVPTLVSRDTCAICVREDVRLQSDWQASVRGRAGWVSGPALFYVTSGFAWSQMNISGNNVFTGSSYPAQRKAVATGWVAGAGAEYALTSHIILGAEYLHYEFGSVAVNANRIPPPLNGRTWTYRGDDLSTDVGRVSIKYKF